jgi:hypothetical protein
VEHERCSWCGAPIDTGDGFRAAEPTGQRRAAFCRLEHIVPWALRGPHWEAGELAASEAAYQAIAGCSQCGLALTDAAVMLYRHRGEHRIVDGFCGVAHLLEWAKAGGRWR